MNFSNEYLSWITLGARTIIDKKMEYKFLGSIEHCEVHFRFVVALDNYIISFNA